MTPSGRKALTHHIVLQPPSSPPAEALTEETSPTSINTPCMRNDRVEIGTTMSGGVTQVSAPVWRYWRSQMLLNCVNRSQGNNKPWMRYRKKHSCVSGKKSNHGVKPWWELTCTTMDISHSSNFFQEHLTINSVLANVTWCTVEEWWGNPACSLHLCKDHAEWIQPLSFTSDPVTLKWMYIVSIPFFI